MTQQEAETVLRRAWLSAGETILRTTGIITSMHEAVDRGRDRSGLALPELLELLHEQYRYLAVAVAEAQRVGEVLLGIRGMPTGENVLAFGERHPMAPRPPGGKVGAS